MIVALDLETTGLDSNNDKIIEVALVKFDSKTFQIIESFSSLVNPGIEIPELITNITNINNEDVKDSPFWKDIMWEVEDFIWDLPILWHNVYFDKNFLVSNFIELETNIAIDTFLLSNALNLQEKSLNLEALSQSFWIGFTGAHRALNDTIATIKVFEKLLKKVNNLSSKNKSLFKFIINKSLDSWFIYILDNFIDDNNVDLSVDSFIGKFTKSFSSPNIIADKIVDKKIKLTNISKIMSNIKWIEVRDNQLSMTNIIMKTFLDLWKVAIEAPTWLGKTFAYLLPSILYSIKTWEQVYISTTTKALQDQIYYKDLRFLLDNLGYSFTFSKLKWKSNYVSIKYFLDFIFNEESLSKERASFILKLILWISDTKYWELDELDYYGKEFWFIKEVNAEWPLTFSSDNPYEDSEFAVIARRKARKSNIVVINNNILFQDISGNNNILWKVKNLVLDEAHNLEDIVTNSLKKSFSLLDVNRSFENIKKQILTYEDKINNFELLKEEILFELWTIFDVFSMYLYKKVSSKFKYKLSLIKKDFFLEDLDKKDLFNSINIKIISLLDAFSILPDKVYLKIWKEITFFENMLDILSIVMNEEKSSKYIQIVWENNHRWTYLEYTHLNAWEYLQKYLWNNLNICILTSATLQIQNSFDYIKNILSLQDFNLKALGSDFDYKKQSTLFVPNSIWSIKNNISEVTNFLYNLFNKVKWNSLVLFTSFDAIKQVYLSLNNSMKKSGINIIAQWIWWWKHKLLQSFTKNADSSILLWTDSFWEWIDIPWNKLKYLVIYKIPFNVPSDPIFIAKSKLFKDPFKEYSIPKSIIKLKQGFWRLIRSKNDKWVVIFLDDRIFSTTWWKAFYDAFPLDINIKIWNDKKIIDVLK